MTYFNYYATTSRNLDRVMQYFVFPLAKAMGLVLFGHCSPENRIEYSSNFARIASAGVYSTLTTAFLGDESRFIDENSRKAVAAELGIEPDKLSFSDFKYSQNTIVSGAYHDMMMLQKYRYGTDALFMLPIAAKIGAKSLNIPWIEHSREVNQRIRNGENLTATQLMISGHNALDFSVLAGKAAYWAGETYLIEKSSHFEIMKLRESLGSTGKDMSFNDLLAVYQRLRNDKKLPMIDSPEEYDALRPLFKKMTEAYNKHDGKFGIPEVVYLIGLEKINVHTGDERTVSKKMIEASAREIDKVIDIGLDGIRKEKQKEREAQGIPDSAVLHEKTFVDRLGDVATTTVRSVMRGIRGGKKPPEYDDYVNVHDPGEVINWNSYISR